jgi:hypothetical protein
MKYARGDQLTKQSTITQSSDARVWFIMILAYSLPQRKARAMAHSSQPTIRIKGPWLTSPSLRGDRISFILTSPINPVSHQLRVACDALELKIASHG